MCQDGEKKGFFAKMFAKMDKKMKEKASQASRGCCCSSEKPQDDGENKEGRGCC